MSDSPLATVMTFAVIGIALALPAMLYLGLHSIGTVTGDWPHRSRISVYLREEVADEQGREIEVAIAALPEVAETAYVSAADALLEFERASGLGEVLRGLPENPLPATILVFPRDRSVADLGLLREKMVALTGVDAVSIDLKWVERLNALLSLGERIVLALGILLGTAVMLVIGNTIRLLVENRRAEIEVVKLVGGTDSFVRRPFLYTGLWYGIGGGAFAVWLIEMCLLWLRRPLAEMLRLYEIRHEITTLGFDDAGVVMAVAAMLGVLGARIALDRQLSALTA